MSDYYSNILEEKKKLEERGPPYSRSEFMKYFRLKEEWEKLDRENPLLALSIALKRLRR